MKKLSLPCHHTRATRSHGSAAMAGFTLLEACLAIGTLAAGMLALMHWQAGLQASVEAARERGEALRLAQACLERQRHFAVLEPDGTARAYAQVGSYAGPVVIGAPAARAGMLRLDITDHPALHHKSARVTVTWRDRQGRAQSVRLVTLIAGIAP